MSAETHPLQDALFPLEERSPVDEPAKLSRPRGVGRVEISQDELDRRAALADRLADLGVGNMVEANYRVDRPDTGGSSEPLGDRPRTPRNHKPRGGSGRGRTNLRPIPNGENHRTRPDPEQAAFNKEKIAGIRAALRRKEIARAVNESSAGDDVGKAVVQVLASQQARDEKRRRGFLA